MATTKKFRVKHGLDAGNNTISFVNDPVSANDAATKNYVDVQVASAPGDVSNSYLTSTFTTNTAFQSYVANTNSRIDTLEAGGTLVTNAYLTSTFTTNTDFQSFVANTNAYIATKTDDTTVLATNTALRTLIDDRMQVANVNVLVDDRMQVANVISYVDTEIAALVNTAPSTLDTLNELANALANDANFSTTVTTNLSQKLGATASITLTGDVTGSGSFSSNAVSIALTDTNLGNTNAYIADESARIDLVNTNLTGTNTALRTLISDRMQVANVTSYTTKYLEVANVASNTSVTSGSFASGNNTITFTRADSSAFDVVLTGVGEVTNAYVTSTYVANTTFQSALANTNSYIATKTDDTVALATNTALRTLISDRIQVANLNTTLADYWPSANVITYTGKYLEVANVSTSASVTVQNTAPTITANGDMWWDNSVGELYVAYANNWVEAVAQDVTPYANNGTFSSSNNTITFVRTDGSQFDVVLTGVGEVTNAYVTSTYTTNTAFQSYVANTNARFTGLGTGDVSNSYLTSTFTTNATFQSALANTNSYIATKTDDTVVLATNTALRTLIDDRMQVANVNVLVNDRMQVANVNLLVNDRLQVANADTKYATWSSLTSTNTAIRAYVDTEVAAIVNSAPATLDTLNELASALGDDANFATTVTTNLSQKLGATATVTLTGDITASATAFSSNAVSLTTVDTNLANTNAYIATKTDDTVALATNTALRTLISDRIQVANLNTTLADYWPSANVITYTAKYLEVANSSSGGASITVSNTAPSITSNGELWWDNAVGELYISYSNNWVEAVPQDITPYTNNATYSSSNTTLTFVRTDGSQYEVELDLSDLGGGDVANSYLTSTYVTNTTFQSALANTNSYIATKADSSSLTAYLEVANLSSYGYATESYVDTEVAAIVNSAPTLLNTLDELASALNDDANFATTVTTNLSQKLGSTASVTLTGDVTGTASFSANALSLATTDTNLANTNAYIATKTDDTTVLATNTALRTLIDDRMQVANVNTTLADYWPSANVITYTAKYLEVANSSSGGGTSLTVSNTAPTITANGELWWDNAVGELYVSYSNNWVEAVAQDITPYTNNVTYSTSNTTLTFTRTDNSQYDVLLDLSDVSGEVSNSYLTSTFVTNTTFQSALANTNSYIATKTDDTTVLATNTALRTLIDDRIQVANADSKYATWSSLTSTNTAIRSYVDTEISALVNSAPSTLDTLEELATALGDDANFSTTVLTLIGTKASNATLTSTYVTNTVFQSALANTNSYIATKTDDTVALATNTTLRTLISDRLQVANAAYVTANTISVKNPANYHVYTVTVASKTSAHPYSGGSSSAYFLDGVESPSIILAPNQTYRFDTSDSTNSSHPLDFYVDADKNTAYTTGVTVNGTAGSAGAYTEIVVDEDTPQVLYYQCQNHSYMGSVASILSDTSPKYMEVANTTSFITSTSLTPYLEVANSTSFITSTSLTPYLEVANVATELADYWPSANIIAYTAKYLEVANNTGSGAANTSTTSATLSGNTATFTRADSSTFTLDLSSLSSGGGGGGASVTVSTTAPSSPSEGDQWFDSEDAIMYIYYDSHWVEVQASQQTLTPYEVNVDTFTANGTATSFGHTADVVSAESMIVTVDGIIQRPTTDYTVSSNTVTFGTAPSNTSIVAIRVTTGAVNGVTNTAFQSALANTNAYIATKGVGDVANSYLTSTYVTNTVFQSALANTNAYIATKLDSANSFSAVTVSGGNTILTTTTGTELNIVAGNNMIIDANDTTKTLTISSSASGGGGGGGASTGTAIAMALIFG